MSGACGRAPLSRYTTTPKSAPPIARPRLIHSASPVPCTSPPVAVSAKCAKIGATMNAATARSSSMIAKTRCKLLDCNEKPATNNAGATVAPRASPVRAEPTSASG